MTRSTLPPRTSVAAAVRVRGRIMGDRVECVWLLVYVYVVVVFVSNRSVRVYTFLDIYLFFLSTHVNK